MSIGLNDLYGGNDVMEEVIILPWLSRNSNTGTITLPAGYTWSDFEYIEWSLGISTNNRSFASDTIQKEQTDSDINWESGTSYDDPTNYICTIVGQSSTTATWTGVGSAAAYPIIMKGYTKRYASRNLSKVIQLTPDNTTGGTFTAEGKIQSNQRYELDIASWLGEDYLNRDLIIRAEVYNDTGSGVEGWGYAGHGTQSGTARFVEANQLNDTIVIQTGISSLTQSSAYGGSPFDHSNQMTTALCRIKVWKIDQYVTTGRNGSSGKTLLFTADSPVTTGVVTLNDDMGKYDALEIYTVRGVSDSFSGTVDTDILASLTGNFVVCWSPSAAPSTDFLVQRLGNSTGTELNTTQSVSGTSGGITRVFGINY